MNGGPPPPDENGAIRPKPFALAALAGYFPSSLGENGFFSILLIVMVTEMPPRVKGDLCFPLDLIPPLIYLLG